MIERIARFAAAAALLVGFSAVAEDQPTVKEPLKIEWVKEKAELGKVADLALPKDVMFANADDARKLLKRMGNIPDGNELGLVVPTVKGQDWFIIYRHHDVGYIKDDDRDKIDADAILESIRSATEEANEERKKTGDSALHVVGWQEKPAYDLKTHNLTWAVLARTDKGDEVVNYNTRMLGRDGYLSATLVDDPKGYASFKPRVEELAAKLAFKKGRSYAEWVPGDKVSQYGLTALVAAGAGAAAVKLGLFGVLAKLLAKAGKVIIIALAALGASIVRLWRSVRAKVAGKPREPGLTP
jgi:uncharacterized membrane-anchored protein